MPLPCVSRPSVLSHEVGAIVKVIFENSCLNDDEKVLLCRFCGDVGA